MSPFQVLRKPKTPETALSPITVSCHPFFLLISVLIHGTALQAVIIHIQKRLFIQHGLYDSMQATRPLPRHTSPMTNAHLTQVRNGFKKVLQPMWELSTMFGCQIPPFLAQGRSRMSQTALFPKVVRVLSFFLSLSVVISETTSQDINLRRFPPRFQSTARR